MLPLEQALATVPAVRDDLSWILGKAGSRDVPRLREAVTLVGGQPDAAARFHTFRELYELDQRRVDQAVADLRLASETAARKSMPFARVAEQLIELRDNDPGRKSDHPSFADLSASLEEALALGGRHIIDLQVKGRAPADALQHAHRLQALKCPADEREAVIAGYRKVMKSYDRRQDAQLLAALDLVDVPSGATERLDAWRRLLDLSRRPAQALADLRLVVEAQQRSGRTFADAATAVVSLRDADPGRKDEYPSFADLSAAVDHVLAGSGPVATRVADLLALRVKGRTPADAFAHEQKLAGTGADVRDAYLGLLKRYDRRHDPTLLALLDALAGRPSPCGELDAFRRLAKEANPKVALGDLRVVQASTMPAMEAADHAVALRDADPHCHDDYPQFGGLADSLAFLAEGKTPDERAERRDLLASTFKHGRGVMEALPHAQRLQKLPVGLRDDYGWLLKKTSASTDSTLLALLDGVAGKPDPAAEVAQLRALMKATGRRVKVCAADFGLLDRVSTQFPTVARAEILGHMVALRRDQKLEEYGSYANLESCLPQILAASDPETREARRASCSRLIDAESDGARAAEDLTYILRGPDSHESLSAVTRKMTRLQSRISSKQRGHLEEVFDRIQTVSVAEPQCFLARWLRLPRAFERIAWRLLKRERSTEQTVAWLDALSRGRFAGEKWRKTWKRLASLLDAPGRKPADSPAIAEAFASVHDASGWGRMTGLLKQYDSAPAASLVWNAMSGAATPAEMERRSAAFERAKNLGGGKIDDAIVLYRAITEQLDPSAAIDAELAALEPLCAGRKADLAAATYRQLRLMRGLPDADRDLARQVFMGATVAADLEVLNARLQTPFKDEPFAVRAQALQPLVRHMESARSATQGVERIAGALEDGEFATLGPAVAMVAGIRAQQGDPRAVATALDVLAWARTLLAKQDPPAEVLSEMSAALLLDDDVEAAKSSVLRTREIRRRSAAGTGGIVRGEDEVTVGAIRIKVRKDEQATA